MEKQISECLTRRTVAAAELADRQSQVAADYVTNSLVFGLNTLRTMLFHRIHEDVERLLGSDSMLMPVSIEEAVASAKQEIEAFQVAVSTVAARDQRYLDVDWAWYAGWLGKLRLCDAMREDRWRRRIRRYLRMDDDQRRLEFSRHLERVFPEATRAPLILYRLFPLAIQIVSAIAFSDNLKAAELRNRQMFWLPGIADCHECHGLPLENGEACHVCGNPLWNYRWLREGD